VSPFDRQTDRFFGVKRGGFALNRLQNSPLYLIYVVRKGEVKKFTFLYSFVEHAKKRRM